MQIIVIGDTATGVSEPGQRWFSVCLGNGMYGKDTGFLGRCEQMLTYSDRGPMTDSSKDTIKLELNEPMSFTEVTYRSRKDLPKATVA